MVGDREAARPRRRRTGRGPRATGRRRTCRRPCGSGPSCTGRSCRPPCSLLGAGEVDRELERRSPGPGPRAGSAAAGPRTTAGRSARRACFAKRRAQKPPPPSGLVGLAVVTRRPGRAAPATRPGCASPATRLSRTIACCSGVSALNALDSLMPPPPGSALESISAVSAVKLAKPPRARLPGEVGRRCARAPRAPIRRARSG